MWNEATKQLVADGKLVVLGVVQEQHAERAQLYKQWKQYKFPIVQDAFTGLGLAVVPVPILIDEHGNVMETRLRPSDIARLAAQKTSLGDQAPKLDLEHAKVAWLERNAATKGTAESKVAAADAHLRLSTKESVAKAIELYGSVRTKAAGSDTNERLVGAIEFRMGVAWRTLFDLENGKDASKFTKASEHWSNALAENPNQYIWRRRIQQYGPRQIKPYPFYDWVEQAQNEIIGRGETPVTLSVPLSGAEIAQRQKKMADSADEETSNPDPDAKITLGESGLINVHSTVVPSVIKPGQTVRVHLRFTPSAGKWNNEADDMIVWVDQNEQGRRSKSKLVVANPSTPESSETRMLEFEFETNKDADSVSATGYALAYICKPDGQCVYRRIEFNVPVKLKTD